MTAPRSRMKGSGAAAARTITEVFAPVVLAVGVVLVVGAASGPSPLSGLVWGLVAAFFVGAVPYAFLLHGVRRGRWTDRHVSVREQRIVPLSFALGSVILGVGVLAVGRAPQELVALVAAGLVGLGVSIAITRHWKMSIHTGVASGTATILLLVFGASMLATWPVVIAVAWSRVELRDHTVAQVVVGGLIGAVIAGVVFSALR